MTDERPANGDLRLLSDEEVDARLSVQVEEASTVEMPVRFSEQFVAGIIRQREEVLNELVRVEAECKALKTLLDGYEGVLASLYDSRGKLR